MDNATKIATAVHIAEFLVQHNPKIDAYALTTILCIMVNLKEKWLKMIAEAIIADYDIPF
jgi:hypothetical protein